MSKKFIVSTIGRPIRQKTKPASPTAPARNVIEHEIRIPNVEPKGPFVGLPRPELDEAWSDLLRPAMLDMPPAEMKKMNKSSVAVTGTGGYVGYYAVFHQLHCLVS